ncbi:MAG: helix-turn-helix domain-containing protein [Patescibacteria group bacterium]|nr:helix-turn-helix domain-containing protein [Patescibacteria group bacterium]
MQDIEPNQIYTSKEAGDFLRLSERTMKRFLKQGIIRANKVGGRYRILGRELLRLVSPDVEQKAEDVYMGIKGKTQKTIKDW